MKTMTTKAEMAKFVKSNAKKVNGELKDMIDYTLKMYKEDAKLVTAQDFRSLVKDINQALKAPAPQASAASRKDTAEPMAQTDGAVKAPSSRGRKKKSEKKAETEVKKPKKKAEEKPEKEVEEKPKKVKKATSKKSKKTESGVKTKNTKGEAFDLAEVFLDEVSTPLGVITKDDSIKNIKDVAKILEKGEKEVMCAVYWTERHLDQFPYTTIDGIPQPESFENDLDLVSIIFVAPDNTLMLGVSAYTFVPYVFSKDSMKQKKGLRYNCGAEFNVYTLDVTEE